MKGTGKIKKVTISAKIMRADGTVEDLGVISESAYTLSGKIKLKLTSWLQFLRQLASNIL